MILLGSSLELMILVGSKFHFHIFHTSKFYSSGNSSLQGNLSARCYLEGNTVQDNMRILFMNFQGKYSLGCKAQDRRILHYKNDLQGNPNSQFY